MTDLYVFLRINRGWRTLHNLLVVSPEFEPVWAAVSLLISSALAILTVLRLTRSAQMLVPLRLGAIEVSISGHPPVVLARLLDAAARGDDLAPVLQSTTKELGFDVFTQGVIMTPRPKSEENQIFLFSTDEPKWMREYDQRAYVEIDPRIHALFETALPLIWDQRTFRGKSEAVDAFLDAAKASGVSSGVAVPIRDGRGHAGMTALNSSIPICDSARISQINERLGEIVLISQCVYELFHAAIVQRDLAPISRGRPLSPRELECLALAARGLTTDDIALKLTISPRTVQFHFDSIRAKLAAINRQEAIAKAVEGGII